MYQTELQQLPNTASETDEIVPVSSTGERVSAGVLRPGELLPLVFACSDPHLGLAPWAQDKRELIDASLSKHGGLLFRGFGVKTPADFEDFIQTVSGDLLEYRERSSPRRAVSGRVYTSTEHPADQNIFLHNENSYQQTFSKKIFFFCETPAEKGGETPIADCRKVFAQINPDVRERFTEKGWMYVRNYGDGFGLPWQTVFQTEDKRDVEEHCRKNKIQFEWKEGNRLRTRATLPAALKHPQTGEMTWFNHATFFHLTTLEEWAQEALLEEFERPDDMPTNTFYGNGSPIEQEVLDELREIYRRQTVVFPWERGDVLMLDNLLVAHGRTPYKGARRILVAMSEPATREQL